MGYQFSFYWVWRYREAFLNGLWTTLVLNSYVIFFATFIGLLLALGRLSKSRVLRLLCWFYIDLFRTLPLLVLLFWLYFAFPLLAGGRLRLDSFAAACVGLTLNLSAFIAEVIRAGILAVPEQHIEAAHVLGLSRAQTLRYIILPISIRQMLPPLTGQYVNAIKLSVLASVIAVPELLHTVQTITTEVFRPIEMYSTLAMLFLCILLPGTWLLHKLERPAWQKQRSAAPQAQDRNERPAMLAEARTVVQLGLDENHGCPQEHVLVIDNVTQAYNGFKALEDISCAVKPGAVLSIIGANGSGKTSLLRSICGFLPLQAGEIRLGSHILATAATDGNGRPCSSEHLLGPTIGLVPQQVEPWPHLTVLENVALSLKQRRGMSPEEANAAATQWLKAVGLVDKATRHAKELSGGLRQRVVLARTLAMRPRVVLLDEVTSALDPEWSAWVRDLIRELARAEAIVVQVSHRLNLVREVSDHVIFLHRGRVLEEGPPAQLFASPQSRELCLFLSCS